MSEPKWTPGPWARSGLFGTKIGSANGRHINARLIAEATELAADCESLCEAIDQMQLANAIGDHDLFMNWAGVVLTRRTKLRATLAKARGE